MNGDISSAFLLVPLRLPHSAGNTPGGGPGKLLKVPRSNCLSSSGSSGTPSPPPTNDNTTMMWVACHSPFHTNYYCQSTTSHPYLLTSKKTNFFFCLLPTNPQGHTPCITFLFTHACPGPSALFYASLPYSSTSGTSVPDCLPCSLSQATCPVPSVLGRLTYSLCSMLLALFPLSQATCPAHSVPGRLPCSHCSRSSALLTLFQAACPVNSVPGRLTR